MNRTISTRTGLLAGLCILLYTLWLQKAGVPPRSPMVLLRFAFVPAATVIATVFLYRSYAGIRFVDLFTHCARTLATLVIVVVLGDILAVLLLSKEPFTWGALNRTLMFTVFTYTLVGLLSAFLTSLLFHNFANNKS